MKISSLLFKVSLHLTLGLLLCFDLKAQKEANNWYFGKGVGINFNSSPPHPLLNSTKNHYQSATISDANGSLLFYTAQSSAFSADFAFYDRNHQMMPNGHGIWSLSYTDLIVPWPGQKKYYFFTQYWPNWTNPNFSAYSLIDMNLRNGLGDVTNIKNKYLTDRLTAKVAVKHQNNRDYWVIFPDKQRDTLFCYSYLISPAGLDTIPVVSIVQASPGGSSGTPGGAPYISKASPDGRTIAFSGDSLKFLSFNPVTGIVTRNFAIFPPGGITGLEFSPDGSKLYCFIQNSSLFPSPGNGPPALLQYDLDGKIPLAIKNSEIQIHRYSSSLHGCMQVAPDGKIYQTTGSTGTGTKYLNAIQRPNLKGKACRFAENVIDLNPSNSGNRVSLELLPNFVQSYFYRPKIVMQQTCFGDTARFELGNRAYVDSVNWNFGDPASGGLNTSKSFTPKHFYAAGGSYNVGAIVHFNYASDTVYQTIQIPTTIVKPNLGPDTTLCQGDTLRLNAYQFGATYEWQDSLTTDPVFSVTRPGTYWVQVSNGCGVRYDTINVAFDAPLTLKLPADTVLCPSKQLMLTVNTVGGRIMWQDSSTANTYTVTKPGTYWAELRNACGIWRDPIVVNYREPVPTKWLPKDTIICYNQPFVIKGNLPQAISYRWQNGSTASSLTVNKSGTYWLDAVTPCLAVRDSIKVTFAWPTSHFSDTTICTGSSFVLKAPAGLSYQWGTGETTRQITISKGGSYSVQMVTLPGCIFFDSIQVKEERCFKEPFIANIITPNNDNLNDRFEPKGLEAGTWELTIYNRWGNQIYKKEDYTDQWPATSISSGVYFYLLRNTRTGKKYKGWLEVMK